MALMYNHLIIIAVIEVEGGKEGPKGPPTKGDSLLNGKVVEESISKGMFVSTLKSFYVVCLSSTELKKSCY